MLLAFEIHSAHALELPESAMGEWLTFSTNSAEVAATENKTRAFIDVRGLPSVYRFCVAQTSETNFSLETGNSRHDLWTIGNGNCLDAVVLQALLVKRKDPLTPNGDVVIYYKILATGK